MWVRERKSSMLSKCQMIERCVAIITCIDHHPERRVNNIGFVYISPSSIIDTWHQVLPLSSDFQRLLSLSQSPLFLFLYTDWHLVHPSAKNTFYWDDRFYQAHLARLLVLLLNFLFKFLPIPFPFFFVCLFVRFSSSFSTSVFALLSPSVRRPTWNVGLVCFQPLTHVNS